MPRTSYLVPPTSYLQPLALPLLSVFLALSLGALIIAATGGDVSLAYRGLWEGSLGSPKAVSETLVAATPYIFAGLGIAFAFRARLFNVGAEGQIAAGALGSVWVGYSVHGLPWPLHLLLALAAGCLAGALWGGIPGILKARTGAHEVITTIMLNYIAIQATSFLLSGPMRDPNPAIAVAQTPLVLESARLPVLLEPFRAGWGLVLALAAAGGAWWLLFRTTIGFEVRTVGANPSAARYAGMAIGRTLILAMALAGLLGGLAGAVEVAGVNYYHSPAFSAGYGFDAIAVALLGKAHPLGVVPAGLLFGGLRAGAPRMQFLSQIPVDVIQIIQALVLLFVAAEHPVRWLYGRVTAGRRHPIPATPVEGETMAGLQGTSTRAVPPASLPPWWPLAAGLAVVALLTVIQLTSPAWSTALVAMLGIAISRTTPLALGALSGILCERSGITNIAIEGLMLAAAFFAFSVAAMTHNLAAALAAGLVAGVLLAGLHALLSIHGRVDQIISGTVVNILSVGLTGYFNRRFFPTGATGVPQLPALPLPALSRLPWVGRVLFFHQPITYLAMLLPAVVHVALYKTPWGLRTRAVGERPHAAESAGVSVLPHRYRNVLLSGVLAGLGGAYFTLESVAHFEPLMTNGRGFIALAAMIFGKWSPLGAWGGALLFGIAEALPVTLQLQGIEVNYFILGMLPYVLTVIVLAGAVGRASPPAALGVPYERG